MQSVQHRPRQGKLCLLKEQKVHSGCACSPVCVQAGVLLHHLHTMQTTCDSSCCAEAVESAEGLASLVTCALFNRLHCCCCAAGASTTCLISKQPPNWRPCVAHGQCLASSHARRRHCSQRKLWRLYDTWDYAALAMLSRTTTMLAL